MITIDPRELNEEQRQYVAGFILSFPRSVATFNTTASVGSTEIAKLAAETPSSPILRPEQFTPAAAAFAIVPNEPAAPSSAAVAPFAIVPEVTAATTSAPMTTNVPQPPAASCAATVATAVPPSANPVTLDKAGLPWDDRIHASSKAFVADGTWRKKRGVDDATVAQVEAQLKALMAVPGAQPPASTTFAAHEWPFPTGAVAGTTTAPVAPAAVPVPPAQAVDPRAAYIGLVTTLNAAQVAKRITVEEVNEICAKYGVPQIGMLISRLDLVPAVAADVDALLATRQQ